MSSSSGSESDSLPRKRVYSDSDSVSEVDEAKAKPAKIAKTVQKSISGFLSSSGERSSPATLPATSRSTLEGEQAFEFHIDCAIEVYRFGHTKSHYKRNTLVSSTVLGGTLSEFKKAMREVYGLEQDARRANIGSYEVDAGICERTPDGSPTFTATTEAEWQSLVSRLRSQSHQFMLLSE